MSDRRSAGATILLVEDHAIAARGLRDTLSRFGHTVRPAASAKDALATLDAMDVDLILLDLVVQGSDGLILCSRLRSRTDAPIIVLSSRPREVDRTLAMVLGASDFVSLPVDADDLRGRITAAVGVQLLA